MRVGILGGTGPLGRGLAVRLAAAGVGVTLGSRDPDRAAASAAELVAAWPEKVLDIVGSDNAAAAACDVVVVSTPWDVALLTVKPLADLLADKVVISVGNALVKQGREMHALVPARGSVAAGLQGALPRSKVAAAGHHLPAASLADLNNELLADVLVCSDHPEAVETTIGLLSRIGGLRLLDAGSLASSAPIEAFTAVLISLNIRYKAHATLRLEGLSHPLS
jgi:hypothetical protein